MQALTLPSRRGWRWLAAGFDIYRKHAPFFAMVFIACWILTTVFVQLAPALAATATMLCIPVFAVSVMNICRVIEQGRTPSPALLLSGFKEHLRTLLILGVLYIAGALAVLGLTALIDDGALLATVLSGKGADEALMAREDFQLATQAGFVLFIPLTLAYWYAPALAAWHGLSAGKALFFSLVACWRNRRAFIVYALGALILGLLLPAVLFILLFGISKVLVVSFNVYFVAVFAPVAYASCYVSYRDVFVSVDEAA